MNVHEEILNSIKDPISFIDKRYRYVYVNNAYSVYFHSRPDELIGKYITDFVDKDHFNKVIKPRFDEGLTGKDVRYEQLLDLKKGQGERRFQVSYHPHYNENKEIDGLIVTVLDKTEDKPVQDNEQVSDNDIKDEKKAEPVIAIDEGNYKLLVNNINDLVCEIDDNGIYTFVNQRYKDILGYEPVDLIGTKAIDLIHPDDLEKSLAKYQQLKEKDKNRVDVWRFKHSNGSYRVIESKGSVYEQEGNVKRTVVVSRDITESVKTEQALNLNVQRYQKAQEIGKVGNWEYNLQTTEFWGSDESKRIYGFDPDSELFSTETVEQCIPERERVHQALIDLIEHDKPYNLEFDILTFDKNVRKTIISIAELERDMDGNPLKVTGVIQDITDRRNAEKKFRESETKYQILFEESNDAIFIHNLDGTILDVNKQALRLFGYSREEYLGKSLFKFHPSSEQDKMKLAKEESFKKASVQFESKYVAKGGKIIDVDVSVKIFDKKRGLVQGILRDITTRKQYEQKILEQNQEYEVLNEELRQSNLELLTAKEIAIENEEKFKSYIENAPDGVFVANEKGRYLDVNKAACNITGYSKDELLNMSIVDLIPESGKQLAREHFQSLIKNGAASGANVYQTKNNETRYWNIDAVKISETLFLGFAKDITERVVNDLELQMAKETAELNERELDLTLEATTDGIWKWNFIENHVYFSPNYYRMLDYKLDIHVVPR
ncbi:MAG: PAS domain S-box protein [Bacteroidales bacterium]|nr:PAS domain S-box protein [Bacteroidales bacterium]